MTRREELILVAGEAIADLILALEAHGGDIEREAASLIEWFIDNAKTMKSQNAQLNARLAEEEAHSKRIGKECSSMVARLSRLDDHLRTLAHYAGGYESDSRPPRDPFKDGPTYRLDDRGVLMPVAKRRAR